MKKSYAQTVSPFVAATETDAAHTNGIWTAGSYNRAPTPEPPPWPQEEPTNVAPPVTAQVDSALVADLTALQASIQALPMSTDTDEVRAAMMNKEAEMKGKLLTSRPLGRQLDGVKGAIERSVKRSVKVKRI